jgi:hypothetical protein
LINWWLRRYLADQSTKQPLSERGVKFAFNGIRWDFGYPEDPPGNSVYMIWPSFLDEYGSRRDKENLLPTGIELLAAMTIRPLAKVLT